MKNINTLFLDFHDSFSLNIVSEFYRQGLEVKVVSYTDLINMSDVELLIFEDYDNLILGPGPGNPVDYLKQSALTTLIDIFLNSPKKFILGICLGHQLIGVYRGYSVVESLFKKHGETVQYQVQANNQFFPTTLEGKILSLQRYNSLTLKTGKAVDKLNNFIGLDENGEILCLRGENYLTYQFHPESIGTIYREEIFLYLANSLYN